MCYPVRVQLNGAGHWEPYRNGSFVVVRHWEWEAKNKPQTEREVILDATCNRLKTGIAIMKEALEMVDDFQCDFPEWWYENGNDEMIKRALDWKDNG